MRLYTSSFNLAIQSVHIKDEHISEGVGNHAYQNPVSLALIDDKHITFAFVNGEYIAVGVYLLNKTYEIQFNDVPLTVWDWLGEYNKFYHELYLPHDDGMTEPDWSKVDYPVKPFTFSLEKGFIKKVMPYRFPQKVDKVKEVL